MKLYQVHLAMSGNQTYNIRGDMYWLYMHRYLPYDHGCEDPPHSYYLSEEFVQLLNGFSFVLIHLQKKKPLGDIQFWDIHAKYKW